MLRRLLQWALRLPSPSLGRCLTLGESITGKQRAPSVIDDALRAGP